MSLHDKLANLNTKKEYKCIPGSILKTFKSKFHLVYLSNNISNPYGLFNSLANAQL